MAINLGSAPIANIYIGNTQIQNVYLGNSLVYSATSAIQTIINNFKTRVANDGGTFEAESNLLSILNTVDSSIGLSKVNMLLTPNAFKIDKVYNVIGSTDFIMLRNTNATRLNSLGLVKLQGSNIMRIDYTSGTPIILDEPQRTNVNTNHLLQDWTGQLVKTNNFATSPDGTQNATRLINNVGSNQGIQKAFTLTAGVTYSLSLYVKLISGNISNSLGKVFVFPQTPAANLDFSDATNEFKRYSMSFIASTTGNVTFQLRTDAISEIHVYGFQIEAGNSTTSLIQSLGAATTRNEDLITVTPPASTVRITTTFLDNSTQVLTTIPATFTLPSGQIRQVVFQNSL